MGLFDKVFGFNRQSTTALDSKEAVAGLMLATAAADGIITEEEAMGLNSAINRMTMFRKQSDQDFSRMMNKLMGLLKKEGPDALMGLAVTSVPENYKLTAFALCADLVTADGEIDASEEQMLEQMFKAMGLDEGTALKILEVMSIKNKA